MKRREVLIEAFQVSKKSRSKNRKNLTAALKNLLRMTVYPPLLPNYVEEEHADTLFYPKQAPPVQRKSIFLNNVESDIQQLKIELDVTNDPDIHFIQGDFYNYYTEKEIIGEGTTGTVKQCFKVNHEETTFAVKIVHYRDDAEMLTMVKLY